jgi:hypothetical protein
VCGCESLVFVPWAGVAVLVAHARGHEYECVRARLGQRSAATVAVVALPWTMGGWLAHASGVEMQTVF